MSWYPPHDPNFANWNSYSGQYQAHWPRTATPSGASTGTSGGPTFGNTNELGPQTAFTTDSMTSNPLLESLANNDGDSNDIVSRLSGVDLLNGDPTDLQLPGPTETYTYTPSAEILSGHRHAELIPNQAPADYLTLFPPTISGKRPLGKPPIVATQRQPGHEWFTQCAQVSEENAPVLEATVFLDNAPRSDLSDKDRELQVRGESQSTGPLAGPSSQSVLKFESKYRVLPPALKLDSKPVVQMLEVLSPYLCGVTNMIISSVWFEEKQDEQVPEQYRDALLKMPTYETQTSVFSLFIEPKQVGSKQRFFCTICICLKLKWPGAVSPNCALGHVRKKHFGWLPNGGCSNEATRRDVDRVRIINEGGTTCPECGSDGYTYQNRARHRKTKMHRDALQKNEEKLEAIVPPSSF